MDKLKEITHAGELINQAVVEVMQLPGSADITGIYRSVMDSKQVELLDLALFCEAEMVKASTSEAHFSGCLMGAAMNEAFLALMCVLFENDVRNTRQFHHSTKRASEVDFYGVVAKWSLEQFIKVAEELNWIPSYIVEKELVSALATGFRELMPIAHPEMSPDEIESGTATFFDSPGPSMLRMAQNLRNAIHAGTWMRRRSRFDHQAFIGWCKLAVVLCGEIRMCLMHQVMSRVGSVADQQLSKLKNMLAALPPELVPVLEAQMRLKLGNPNFNIESFDRLVGAMMASSSSR